MKRSTHGLALALLGSLLFVAMGCSAGASYRYAANGGGGGGTTYESRDDYESIPAIRLTGMSELSESEPPTASSSMAFGEELAGRTSVTADVAREEVLVVRGGGEGSGASESTLPAPPAPPPDDHRAARLASAAVAPTATATDATEASTLMVYTAGFHVGVYQVRQAQTEIADAATSLGGFVASQTDDSIVIRVPAARFYEAVERVSGTGDVLHREVRATDVSEEFRDNDIRLRNLEAMRRRLEELLTRATDVEDALRVERELERITVELERLRGRQRYLADRVALSTIAVTFRAIATESITDAEFFVLPFPWLRTLGLPSLLRVE